MAAARWAKDRLSRPAPEGQARKLARVGRERARAGTDEQVKRTLDGEHRDASERARNAPKINRLLDDRRAQLERIGRERADALARGDTRRAAELGHRGERVKGEIERRQEDLSRARRVASEGDRALRGTGQAHTRERREDQDRFLDAQAALPASARARRASERRDYAAMSQLAGFGREEYERLDPRCQRAARLEIDRELALRRDLTETARSFGGEVPRVGRRERRKADMKFDSALQQRMRAGGHGMPASRREHTALDSWLAAGRSERRSTPDRASGEPESSVMRDAREVAARRKRQLGRDRP
jgi:hypothetical protein